MGSQAWYGSLRVRRSALGEDPIRRSASQAACHCRSDALQAAAHALVSVLTIQSSAVEKGAFVPVWISALL